MRKSRYFIISNIIRVRYTVSLKEIWIFNSIIYDLSTKSLFSLKQGHHLPHLHENYPTLLHQWVILFSSKYTIKEKVSYQPKLVENQGKLFTGTRYLPSSSSLERSSFQRMKECAFTSNLSSSKFRIPLRVLIASFIEKILNSRWGRDLHINIVIFFVNKGVFMPIRFPLYPPSLTKSSLLCTIGNS